MLREAEAFLERAYRGASDQPIVIANLASMLRTNADLRVLAKRINVGAMRLAGDDAMQLINALLNGPERAPILAELAADPGWRRSAELFAQYAVLAPSSTLTYGDAMDRALRTRDDVAAAAVLEQLHRAKSLDTSNADAAYHRRADGTGLATEEVEIIGAIARDTEILAGKLDDRSRAATLARQADYKARYGTIWNQPGQLTAAITNRTEAAKLWPALTDETSIAEAVLDQVGLGADASRWSKLRRERGAAATLAHLVAAKDPLATKIRGTSTWPEIAKHLRAAVRQRPEVDDVWLARLLDDPAISAWASKVDNLERLRCEAFSILTPADPRWSEGLALLAGK